MFLIKVKIYEFIWLCKNFTESFDNIINNLVSKILNIL